MKTMSDNTSALESLTEIESKLLDGASVASITGVFHFGGYRFLDAYNFLVYALGYRTLPDPSSQIEMIVANLTDIQDELEAGTPLPRISVSWGSTPMGAPRTRLTFFM